MNMSKKGMAGGINIIVVIIIGTVMLIGSLALFFNLFQGATEADEQINEQLRQQLLDRHNDGGPVFIYPSSVDLSREDRFYVGVNNIDGDEANFFIDEIEYPADVEQDGISFTHQPVNNVGRGQSDIMVVLIDVDDFPAEGQHRFLVRVESSTSAETHGARNVFLHRR